MLPSAASSTMQCKVHKRVRHHSIFTKPFIRIIGLVETRKFRQNSLELNLRANGKFRESRRPYCAYKETYILITFAAVLKKQRYATLILSVTFAHWEMFALHTLKNIEEHAYKLLCLKTSWSNDQISARALKECPAWQVHAKRRRKETTYLMEWISELLIMINVIGSSCVIPTVSNE